MAQDQSQDQKSTATTPPWCRSALAERRGSARIPVIKSAKLQVGGELNESLYNCLVLDESATGVLIDLGSIFVLPEEMAIHMTGGTSHRARKCWAVGTKAGLEFIGGMMMSAEAAAAMDKMLEMLRSEGFPATMAALRRQNFWGHEALREAAEAAQTAYDRLELMLTRAR